MTQDEIMKMAHKAGLHIATDVNWMPVISLGYAERFAKLVAEQEREACAVAAEKESLRGLPEEQPEGEELLRACAQIAGGVLIADAIRARGQA
jgi:hypothetical protein